MSENDTQIGSLSLKVKSDTNSAIKGLDKLKETLNKLKSVSTGKNMGLNGLKELSSSLARLKNASLGIKLNSIASGISKIKESLSGVGKSVNGITRLTAAIEKLGVVSKSLAPVAGSVEDIKSAVKISGNVANRKIESLVSKEPIKKPVINIAGAGGARKMIDEDEDEIKAKTNSVVTSASKVSSTLDNIFSKGSESFSKSASNLDLLKLKLEGYKNTLADIFENKKPGSENQIVSLTSKIRELSNQIEGLESKGLGFSKNVSPIKSGFESIKNSISNAHQKLSAFTGSLGRIGMYRAVRAIISQISNGIKEGISNVYQYSKSVGGAFSESLDKLATSALRLKNSLGTLLTPLIVSLTPTIQFVIDKISTLLNYVNQFVSAMSGKTTWLKAKDYATEYADSAEKASKASVKAGKAATKSAKQVEDAVKKATIGIDELNIIERKHKDISYSSPIKDIVSPSAGGKKFSEMFEETPIDKKILEQINKIEALVWASMFAIGLILFFTGHPLIGLGFMIVGAYKFAKNAEANWGYLKEKLSEVMAGPLGMFAAIGGSLAILIGFLLVCSGAKPEIGLGLIAMGAVGVAISIVANWDFISEKLKGPIGIFNFIAGSLAILLGAVLLFAGGANPIIAALGLGLIAMGTVGVATSIVANWDFLKNKFTEVFRGIGKFFIIGGIVAITIGILLLFTPLFAWGLGLIASGVILGSMPLAIDFNWVDKTIKNAFSDVIGWLKNTPGVKVTLGIIMCMSGKFGEGLNLIWQGIKGVFGIPFVNSSNSKPFIKDKLSEATSEMSSGLDKFNSEANKKLNNSKEMFKLYGENIPNSFTDGIKTNYPKTSVPIRTWSEKTHQWFSPNELNNKFNSSGSSIVENFKSGVRGNYESSSAPIRVWSEKTHQWFSPNELDKKFEGTGGSVVNSFTSGVSAKKGSTKIFMSGVGDDIVTWFNPTSGFEKSGENSVIGYMKGFINKYGSVTKAIEKHGIGILNHFNNAIKVQSPSKLFMKSGEYSVEGYNIGIENKMGSTISTIKKWVNSFKDIPAKLIFDVDAESLKYDLNDFSGKIDTEISSRSTVSVSGIKEEVEEFYRNEILPLINQIARDTRTQANKEEKTVVQIGGRDIEESVSTQRLANGYNFLS